MMLPSDELDAIRIVQNLALPDAAQIRRKTEVNSALGVEETWANHGSPVACRIGRIDRQPEERAIVERVGALVGYTVTLPASTDVTEADRLIISSRTFEIIGVIKKSYETALKLICVEMT
jgi:head-tail adaptor